MAGRSAAVRGNRASIQSARGHVSSYSDTDTDASVPPAAVFNGLPTVNTAGPVKKAREILKWSALANTDTIIERRIIKEALLESKRRWANCMMLPVMWIYFIFYALAASTLENPQQRHLVEAPVREALMPMLEEDESPTSAMLQGVTTLPEVWEFLDQTYIPLFFAQNDSLGNPLPEGEWGTIFQYNQVFGVVRMQTQRAGEMSCSDAVSGTSKFFGLNLCFSGSCESPRVSHMKCYPIKEVSTAPFGKSWEELPDVDGTSAKEYYLGPSLQGGVDEILNCEGEAFTTAGCGARRLAYLREDFSWMATMAGFLSSADANDDAKYSMHLDSRDTYAKTVARSQYLKNREWLDDSTTSLSLTALYVNTDLDQPWIVQVLITFQFSRGGGVFTYVDMTSVSTNFWGSDTNGFAFSALFFGSLLVSTYSVWHLIKLAKNDRDWKILVNGANGVTVLSVLLGWITIVLYIMKMNRLGALEIAINEYNDRPDDPTDSSAIRLHEAAQEMVGLIGSMRSFIAVATLVFNLRAFVSLQFQPRLAVVIRTLIESSSDMFHFMIIMLSTVIAFALSGMILYGKRLQDFATPWAALMTCFKIMMENEFKWRELSADHFTYWSALVWTACYLCIGVVLLLNMVLAIIMDVYQEVRQESGDSMTMLADAVYLYRNFVYRKLWISERTIISALSEMPAYITLEDLRARFPEMHQYQLDYIVSNCQNKAKIISRVGVRPGETAEMVAAIHISLDEVLKDLQAMKQSGWMCKGLEVGNDSDREHVKDILTSVAVQSHWMSLLQQHIADLKEQVILDSNNEAHAKPFEAQGGMGHSLAAAGAPGVPS